MPTYQRRGDVPVVGDARRTYLSLNPDETSLLGTPTAGGPPTVRVCPGRSLVR